MSKEKVIELLTRGGLDESFRLKYNAATTRDIFVQRAAADGYEFTVQELNEVLRENGDSFDSYGNPPRRMIWIKD